MPPNTNTSGSFEETMFMQTALEKAIDNAVSADRTLVKKGHIYNTQTQTHAMMMNLLGSTEDYNKVIGKDTLSVTPDVAQRVVSHMLETNKGINNLIRDKIKKPEIAEITIGSSKIRLSTKISDPTSEDARMLAWYFENVATNAEKDRAFDYISGPGQVALLRAILKARKAYDDIVADPKNFKIGDSAVTPPSSDTQIGRLQQQYDDVVADETAAKTEIAKPVPAGTTVDVSMYREEVKQARAEKRMLQEKIAELDIKRDGLKGKLDEVFAVPGVTFPGGMLPDTAVMATKLDKAALGTELGKSTSLLMLATTGNTLNHYLTNDDVRIWTDDLASSLGRVGTKAPTAAEALTRVMGSEYRGGIPDSGQRAKFIQRMRTMLSHSATGLGGGGAAEAAGAVAPAVTPDAAEPESAKKGGLFGWVSGKVKSVGAYMMEKDKNLLGFKVSTKE